MVRGSLAVTIFTTECITQILIKGITSSVFNDHTRTSHNGDTKDQSKQPFPLDLTQQGGSGHTDQTTCG